MNENGKSINPGFHLPEPERQTAMESFPRVIKAFQAMIHRNNVEKGFWDHPRNDGEMFMLCVTELAEGFEYLRHGNPPSDHIGDFSGAEEELADCMIRIMDICQARGYRLADAIMAKMAFNATRPHMHGKKC